MPDAPLAEPLETRSFTLSFEGPAERPVHGAVHFPASTAPAPAIILCHGFKGFMEWGFHPHLATLLAERGYVAVRFNFPGSGMTPEDDLVTDIEAFRTATFTADLEALERIITSVGKTIAPGRVDSSRIGLFGHSRGGGIALLAAAGETRGQVSALVTWAAVGTFDRLDDAEKRAWRDQGAIPIVNARTQQELPLGVEVLNDLEAHREELDLSKAAAERKAPWLILHGEEDETVPIREAGQLHAAAASPASLLRIDQGSHTFNVSHPFTGPSPQLIEAMNATQSWFRKNIPLDSA